MRTAYELLQRMTDKIVENKEFLTDLDRAIGDADHGSNMARGFKAVMEVLPGDETDIGILLKKVGMTLLSKVGGASGPLYGTFFMKAGSVATGKSVLTLELMSTMLETAIEGVKQRGRAEKGEKTMLDALIPAFEALKASKGEGLAIALDKAYQAAAEGVEYTKTIRATKGRASYLGERSIGHQDPGATSSMLILETLKEYYSE